jgi:hypothetical protein
MRLVDTTIRRIRSRTYRLQLDGLSVDFDQWEELTITTTSRYTKDQEPRNQSLAGRFPSLPPPR